MASISDVNSIVNDPEIYELTRCDGCPKYIEMPDHPLVEYFGFYEGGIQGLITLHPWIDGKQIHMSMTSDYRHLGREFVKKILAGQKTVYANIPEFNKSVINMAIKCGFVLVGFDGEFSRDGIVHKKVLLCRK